MLLGVTNFVSIGEPITENYLEHEKDTNVTLFSTKIYLQIEYASIKISDLSFTILRFQRD